MKKLVFSILAIAGMLAVSSCNNSNVAGTEASEAAKAQVGAIVYFNLDKVIEEYDMANDLRAVVETKANSISQEVNRRGNKLDKDIKAFQDKINKGLLTQSVAEAQNAKLQQQQYEFQQYTNQKQQEIAEEQQVMMNQIADAIKTYIDEYNEQMGYAMIITTQGDILPAPVVAANADLDITDALIEGLNAKYVKEKANNKAQ